MLLGAGLLAFSAAGCGGKKSGPSNPVIVLPDVREPCADHNPLRNPYFGDLHVHTRLSFDAAAWGTRATPSDAYRYARGEPLGLYPYDAQGNGTRVIQLARPLDFAADTEHAEFLAEVNICTDPTSAGYETQTCTAYRNADPNGFAFGDFNFTFLTHPPKRPPVCDPYDAECIDARNRVWQQIQDAAETFYDRTSACKFTTFVAYEWSGVSGATANIHRNVIFRNRSVPSYPVSYVDAPTPDQLWDALDHDCNDSGTPCEALAIPHNSNVGGGLMFQPVTMGGAPYTRQDAERRARLEPLIEIYQHKGASECLTGVQDPLSSEDEACNFEIVHPSICTGSPSDPIDCTPLCTTPGSGGLIGGCVSVNDFARPALLNGLAEWKRVGADPFEFGFIGSTDTHNGAPGQVWESGWQGHLAGRDDTVAKRLRPFDIALVGINTNSPGGLAVLWAEENSRDSLFDAMKRREAYGTSGTRIIVRFFGGWTYPANLCSSSSFVATGYQQGVPMGGELPARPAGATAPMFAVSAMRDAMSVPLQRIQIIKGWMEGDQLRQQVLDVVGGDDGSTVDTSTCTPNPTGSDSLCTVWTDPSFDPTEPAFYYARVLEDPTCRWSQLQCLEAGVDCSTLPAGDPLAACCNGSLPKTIQERAWTSPIWYLPS